MEDTAAVAELVGAKQKVMQVDSEGFKIPYPPGNASDVKIGLAAPESLDSQSVKAEKKKKSPSSHQKKAPKERRTKATQPKSTTFEDPEALIVGKVNEDVYVVEKICDKKVDVADGMTKYWIKWKGWGMGHNTWEPIENLEGCLGLVKKFEDAEAKKASKKGKRGGKAAEEQKPAIVVQPTEKNKPRAKGKADGVLDEDGNMRIHGTWPVLRIPEKVLVVSEVERELCYLIECKPEKGAKVTRVAGADRDVPDINNVVMIRGSVFRELFPHMIIQYYEEGLQWQVNDQGDNEVARKAAMAMNKKSDLEENQAEKNDGESSSSQDERADEQLSVVAGSSGTKSVSQDSGAEGPGKNADEGKMDVGNDSDSDDDFEIPKIRIRPPEELFEDKFGLPKDLNSSGDDDDLLALFESDSDDEFHDVSVKYSKKTKSVEQVIV